MSRYLEGYYDGKQSVRRDNVRRENDAFSAGLFAGLILGAVITVLCVAQEQ